MAARRLRGRRSVRRVPVEPRRSGSSGARRRACCSFGVRGVLAVALSLRSSSTRASSEGAVRRIELSTPDELADVDLQTAGESHELTARPRLRAWDARRLLRVAWHRRLFEARGTPRRRRALDLVAPGRAPLCDQRPRAARWHPARSRSRRERCQHRRESADRTDRARALPRSCCVPRTPSRRPRERSARRKDSTDWRTSSSSTSTATGRGSATWTAASTRLSRSNTEVPASRRAAVRPRSRRWSSARESSDRGRHARSR